MSKKTRKSASFFMAMIAIIMILSSCNRGMGCPTNFSLENVVPALVEGGNNGAILE